MDRNPNPNPRPNVLIVLTDQQSSRALSCAGNPHLHTPAMDQLAARGTLFRQAYCANPVCVASRVAMFTGHYPHEAEIYCNVRQAPRLPELPWLGRLFRDAGYATGYVGKWHLVLDPRDQRDVHGFEYCPLERFYNDHLVVDPTREFLLETRDRPFLLVSSFVNPHDVCQVARGQALPNGSIPDPPPGPECPPLPANFAISGDEPDVLREVQARYREKLYPTANWDEARWRQYLWSYYRLVELVDARIHRVLNALDESGHARDTVVIFASDHGEGIAEHHWNQKQALYDAVARVPFIVSWQDHLPGGRVDDQHLVSTGLDLVPTACDFAGIPVPPSCTGRSVRPLAEAPAPGAEMPWRAWLVTETEFTTFQDVAGPHYGPSGRMVRSGRYKYCAYTTGDRPEALYDITRDPGETTNLACDPAPALRDVLARHRAWLREWAAATGDDFPARAGWDSTRGK